MRIFIPMTRKQRPRFPARWSGLCFESLEYRRFLEVNVGAEIKVNTFTDNRQVSPAVATYADGDFVVAWQSNGQDAYDIYFQLFNASGTPRGSEKLANTHTLSRQVSPSVARDNAGNFIIVWASNGQDGDNYGIFARRFNSRGNAIDKQEFRVNTFIQGRQMAPSVAMNSSGGFVIAWESNGQDSSGYGIYAQSFDAAGEPLGAKFTSVNLPPLIKILRQLPFPTTVNLSSHGKAKLRMAMDTASTQGAMTLLERQKVANSASARQRPAIRLTHL